MLADIKYIFVSFRDKYITTKISNMITREEVEEREIKTLKPYATFSKYSEERSRPLMPHPYRTCFQRDRDRITNTTAFRRMEYKTQVFLSSKDDHLRTRLTHTLEVNNIATTIAQILGVNIDLTSAIAIGHDIGHTPFGHAGERTLNKLLEPHDLIFKHNVQSIRIVEKLSKKYSYEGINLTLAVKEGIIKHTSIPGKVPEYCANLHIDKKFSQTIEGQIVYWADEIAQMTHDLDDYLRYNTLDIHELIKHDLTSYVNEYYESVYGVKDHIEDVKKQHKSNPNTLKDIMMRCYVDFLVSRLSIDSSKALKDCDKKSLQIDKEYVNFDDEIKVVVQDFHQKIKLLLFNDNYTINEMDKRGTLIIESLFNFYTRFPYRMPDDIYEKYKAIQDCPKAIVIADFIAGMTDRFAISEYNKIIDL